MSIIETVLVIIFLLSLFVSMLWYNTPKCKHKWVIIKDETTESQAEHYGRLSKTVPNPKYDYQLEGMTSRKKIVILQCECCGKLDKTVEKI